MDKYVLSLFSSAGIGELGIKAPSDGEVFARLLFYGVTLLNRTEEEVWLMPLGHLLDQWEIYKQFNGLAKSKRDHFIDEVIPYGV